LHDIAREVGFAAPVDTGRRQSRYQGELYCALLSTRLAAAASSTTRMS
jgi:hypothetical protein